MEPVGDFVHNIYQIKNYVNKFASGIENYSYKVEPLRLNTDMY